jgi:hypothetical protein
MDLSKPTASETYHVV